MPNNSSKKEHEINELIQVLDIALSSDKNKKTKLEELSKLLNMNVTNNSFKEFSNGFEKSNILKNYDPKSNNSVKIKIVSNFINKREENEKNNVSQGGSLKKKSVVKNTVTKKLVVKKPVTKKPVTKKLVTKKPVVEKPVVKKPVAKKSVSKK
jgi:hypothetical protein